MSKIEEQENNENVSLDMHDDKSSKKEQKKDGKKKTIVILVLTMFVLLLVGGYFVYKTYFIKKEKSIENTKVKEVHSKYRMSGNGLEAFDLSFLQLENENKNTVYSPLSIKYALQMLKEGSNGDSKKQIDSVIGEYKANKYNNSTNMSFANAMFIRNSYKDQIKESYTSNLSNKYNAEVILDSFERADNVNSWVNNKTFGLINNLFDDISDYQYILINALAIDMEWNYVIQADGSANGKNYHVTYPHINYGDAVDFIDNQHYESMPFNNNSMNVKSLQVGASINNYDIVKELGEENIRKTVGDGYRAWLKDPNRYSCGEDLDVNSFLDKYIKEINESYKQIDTSTDFSFYHDEDLKVFAKDLKQYDNTILQYIGIMPKRVELTDYISKMNAKEINEVINKLKTIELNNFEYGKVYKITGKIPLFKFDYELDLVRDLNQLGIKDVFDPDKADLSNLSKAKDTYIGKAAHKANIEFSNHGIKASAVTYGGGLGAAGCGYEYKYDVPVETIDLTFDRPYLFLIRDKTTGEVWFSGKVYQPTAH